jgi:hypothetical protein
MEYIAEAKASARRTLQMQAELEALRARNAGAAGGRLKRGQAARAKASSTTCRRAAARVHHHQHRAWRRRATLNRKTLVRMAMDARPEKGHA